MTQKTIEISTVVVIINNRITIPVTLELSKGSTNQKGVEGALEHLLSNEINRINIETDYLSKQNNRHI